MLAISLTFPAKRFHATPWGRQVNEGAIEWPPSPWRLLRALVAVWHHKIPDVPESDIQELVESLAIPPRFFLPPASQGHTRHYMPLVNNDRTKVFDSFVAVSPDDAVIAVWPDVNLPEPARALLGRLLAALSYFGRAESWVEGALLDEVPQETNAIPCEQGEDPPPDCELVRTLLAIPAEEHRTWYMATYEQHRQRKLAELTATALAKGKPTDSVKLSRKDDQFIKSGLPASLFEALHVETATLRKAGWNQPPGTRWINYARRIDAFASKPRRPDRARRVMERPTVARFAVSGTVRPLLTDAISIGERVRSLLMGCSKHVRHDHNAAQVFSGKYSDSAPLSESHGHAHFLCEAAGNDGRISHLTVFAPMGFDADDERAFSQLMSKGVWGHDGYDLQLALLGVGHPDSFGGMNEGVGESRLLAESRTWESRTPFVPTRHMHFRAADKMNPESQALSLARELKRLLHRELLVRPQFANIADRVEIIPLLAPQEAGTKLGGHFTSWLKFRTIRKNDNGSRTSSRGYGFRLVFPHKVSGPISLGYASHYGLGLFAAAES